ncbi:DUF924 family protein [Pseudomonas sp. DTU_2021_1001937_2_SI_NGA_ILE_001]|uniref:DUF924 family protein n=1 Tax=Pseudomonas sp. DTU_2021_1001937_2_SI_NGA_ILE_001 TaxID=3077589 RepID=UPI0028FC11A8|nr:DUF924 family protein [Pseudomonas sp. DTU_2021_1001937_2_SI_NGA_ILE_001]WNW12965.1 DUF924 family protein [Pseudomonas sp. DTU_2021_1001937_2_SI_NGA_ILE_001]
MSRPWLTLLEWWFGPAESPAGVLKPRNALWFGKHPANDREARERFGEQMQQALHGGLQDWLVEPQGWLALVLLLDQLPRMIHRDTAQAWSGDARAQALVRDGLAQGRDLQLLPLQRTFIYLVLEHSEDLADQNHAIERFKALLDAASDAERDDLRRSLDYAERHQRIIARFGRFPHRNAPLGRASTAEELAFLETPGSSF